MGGPRHVQRGLFLFVLLFLFFHARGGLFLVGTRGQGQAGVRRVVVVVVLVLVLLSFVYFLFVRCNRPLHPN